MSRHLRVSSQEIEGKSQKPEGRRDVSSRSSNPASCPSPMTHCPLRHPSLSPGLFLSSALCLLSLLPPAYAHKTQVAGDVAGVWHIDPNHNPKAGESARIWVALTRRGGQILPLNQASCRMSVFNQPRKAGDKPLVQPVLSAINAERYRGIPGATVTFPKVGLYQLELNCSPKTSGNFQPFRLVYDVTVAR
ncbi:MAG: hypothetical protein IGS48_19070 [Oscillatoriales cyanobacterium C42_A2020_001]|nr:hypothetical protein [Leptolyngbyaceae cyanobacterium C42_A2020_001]